MLILLSAFLSTLGSMFRARSALQLENLALRHQIGVLKRSAGKRPKLTAADRLFWVFLRRIWDNWRSALNIVQPATVIAWHPRLRARLDRVAAVLLAKPDRPQLFLPPVRSLHVFTSHQPFGGFERSKAKRSAISRVERDLVSCFHRGTLRITHKREPQPIDESCPAFCRARRKSLREVCHDARKQCFTGSIRTNARAGRRGALPYPPAIEACHSLSLRPVMGAELEET
jgi:hypothetical protein